MSNTTNEIILLLDFCAFLKKIKSEYWNRFGEYYFSELRNCGFEVNYPFWKIKQIAENKDLESNLKFITNTFGKEYSSYYTLFLYKEAKFARLAQGTKEKFYITDCYDVALDQVWKYETDDDKYTSSINELISKGFSYGDISKLMSSLELKKAEHELNKKKEVLINGVEKLDKRQEKLFLLFKNCDIRYKSEVISNADIIQSLEAFYLRILSSEEHVTGISLHTGSICFNIIDFIVVVFLCILNNEWNNDDIISTLNNGDPVVYKGKRYIYEGIQSLAPVPHSRERIQYIVLSESANKKFKIPFDNHPAVYPYNGRAVTTKGAKGNSNKRTQFLQDALDYSKDEITGIISSSVVVVMKKSIADEILNNVTINCNGNDYEITDLIRISYFTDSNKEIRYKGNSDNNEASIKICPTLSVAADQLSGSDRKTYLAVAIFDERILTRDVSNLDLFLNNPLNFSFVSAPVYLPTAFDLLEHSENRKTFACTKSFLLNNIKADSERLGEIGKINRQISSIVDKEIKVIDVEDDYLSWNQMKICKDALKRIADNNFASLDKDDFVVLAHSLLNYYKTTVFDEGILQKMYVDGTISASPPQQKFDELLRLTDTLPEEIDSDVITVVEYIDSLSKHFGLSNPKYEELSKILRGCTGKNVLIVVPKPYYETIIKCVLSGKTNNRIYVSTARKIDRTQNYDMIILVGEDLRFNPELCMFAKQIIYLLYDCEKKIHDYMRKKNSSLIRGLNTEISAENDLDDEADIEVEKTVISDKFIENVLTNTVFERKMNELLLNENKEAHGSSSSTLKVKRVAKLEDNRTVFFSQYYKAYVFNEIAGEIVEKEVADLAAGDMVIFTAQKSSTLDVIDDVLSSTQNSLNENNRKCYERTKRWRKVLKEYYLEHKITITELGEVLKNNGLPVDIQAVRIWLDDYAHTICPQAPESLRVIGQITNDEDLMNNYMDYYESGRIVKKIRANIRQLIKTVIFSRITNKEIVDSDGDDVYKQIAQYISDNYDELCDVGIIENLWERDISSVTPYSVNRPLEMQEVNL